MSDSNAASESLPSMTTNAGLNNSSGGYNASRRKGWLALIGTLCIWSGFILASRAAGKGTLTAWDVTALRLAMGGLLALFFLPRVTLPPLKIMLPFALLGGIGYACFIYSGFRLAPAAHGAILGPGSLPLSTAVLTWLLLKKSPSRPQAMALLGMLAGITLILTDSVLAMGGHLTSAQLLGDGLFICASYCWAAFTLLLRRHSMPPLTAAVATVLCAAVLYLPVWWLFLPSNLATAAQGEIVFQALFQGVLVVFVALILFAQAVRQLGPQVVALTLALVPVIASLAAVPLLGEPLSLLALAGLAMVTFSAMLGVRASR
ncbi:MAG: DMT family transporter [Rugosibacter sp.]